MKTKQFASDNMEDNLWDDFQIELERKKRLFKQMNQKSECEEIDDEVPI